MNLSLKNDYTHNDDGTTTVLIKSKKYGTLETALLTEDLIRIDKWASQPHINPKGEWTISATRDQWDTHGTENFYAQIGMLHPEGGWTKRNSRGYRYRRRTTKHLHRLVMDPGEKMMVDHIDGNGLNNLRENLRVCTNSENQRNRRKHKGLSKFKGVKPTPWNTWEATIQKTHIGTFPTEDQAARAYDEKAKELFGEYANLNFPDE